MSVRPFEYPFRTSTASFRVPTPPRIVVPPPTLNSSDLPEIPVTASKDLPFAATLDYAQIIKENAVLEWSYGRRREAQLILPHLYLGPMTVLKDRSWLEGVGISCVVGVWQKGAYVSRFMQGPLQRVRALDIDVHTITLDAGYQNLIHILPTTSMLISDHIAQSYRKLGKTGKVLVFCESGNERGAAIVAAYLMERHDDLDYIRAMQLCQAQRFCVNFDDALKSLLQSYWDILCARRAVNMPSEDSRVGRLGPEGAERALKRGLQRDADENTDGMEPDDQERFGGRDSAPFVDMEL